MAAREGGNQLSQNVLTEKAIPHTGREKATWVDGDYPMLSPVNEYLNNYAIN